MNKHPIWQTQLSRTVVNRWQNRVIAVQLKLRLHLLAVWIRL